MSRLGLQIFIEILEIEGVLAQRFAHKYTVVLVLKC